MKHHVDYGRLSCSTFRAWLKMRRFLWKPQCRVFATGERDAINRIRMINLDRHPLRLKELWLELSRIVDRDGRPLSGMSKRFPAVDAERLNANYAIGDLEAYYSLADQLFVEPDNRIPIEVIESNQHIAMTKQEVAVALSHIALWKEVAEGADEHVLILEDDTYFTSGFGQNLEKAWNSLHKPFDLLYVSHKEAKSGARLKAAIEGPTFCPLAGLWQLSGYVLSRSGARKLLSRLPVRGPVDLWINLQFGDLRVYATRKSIVNQRPDGVSSNSYSILPILSKAGVLGGGPSLFAPQDLPKPVFATGCDGSGLTSLATALSILGYRCCSDATQLCSRELERLRAGSHDRAFDAYVNVGSLGSEVLREVAELYPEARIIHLSIESCECGNCESLPPGSFNDTERFLSFHLSHPNPWQQLCGYLGCNLPVCDFPKQDDLGQRLAAARPQKRTTGRRLMFDVSPWVMPESLWSKTSLMENGRGEFSTRLKTNFGEELDHGSWQQLHETFPSNLAYFQPDNFVRESSWSDLCLRSEDVSLRAYTSASVATRDTFRYGRFTARIRASDVPGVVSGVFLHRNSPRQEIDIEILGKDPTRMLTNVFYNPGVEGTKYDYGYRGTPIQIDLGFDASRSFHDFTIEWVPEAVRWFVDGNLVHERVNWAPTPIPNMPMKFYVNLWPSESQEFAGDFHHDRLPTSCSIERIQIDDYTSSPDEDRFNKSDCACTQLSVSSKTIDRTKDLLS